MTKVKRKEEPSPQPERLDSRCTHGLATAAELVTGALAALALWVMVAADGAITPKSHANISQFLVAIGLFVPMVVHILHWCRNDPAGTNKTYLLVHAFLALFVKSVFSLLLQWYVIHWIGNPWAVDNGEEKDFWHRFFLVHLSVHFTVSVVVLAIFDCCCRVRPTKETQYRPLSCSDENCDLIGSE